MTYKVHQKQAASFLLMARCPCRQPTAFAVELKYSVQRSISGSAPVESGVPGKGRGGGKRKGGGRGCSHFPQSLKAPVATIICHLVPPA